MSLTIRPSDATLGATLTGVSLAALDAESWREIEGAFHEYAVLIFPQQHLSAESQLAFARRFGEIEVIVEGLQTVPISNKRRSRGMARLWQNRVGRRIGQFSGKCEPLFRPDQTSLTGQRAPYSELRLS